MQHSVTGDYKTDAVISVFAVVLANIFSWQQHAEWVFRILSLAFATGVSAFALYGYIQKYFPNAVKKFKSKFKKSGNE